MRSRSSPSQANDSRENTYASASATYGSQELPCVVREVVRPVEADVAAPDGGRSGRAQRGDQARRLRVVDDHDVTRAHALGERGQVVGQYLLVDGAGGVVERSTVSDGAVQSVVDALGNGEEIGRALDHHPADVNAGAPRVGDQRFEQLRDAAAASGRVHVPDDPAGQKLAGPQDALLECLPARWTQHGPESRGAHRRCLDFKHGYSVR